jgi:hypothetical protein
MSAAGRIGQKNYCRFAYTTGVLGKLNNMFNAAELALACKIKLAEN